jgi:Putative adhesin
MSDEVVDMSKDWPDDGPELVRQQSWPADGPAELELSVDLGRIRVQLDEQVGDAGSQEVRVEVRHDPAAGGTWSQGISGLLNWLGGPPDGAGGTGDLEQLAAQAVHATEISWNGTGRRLVVRSPAELPLRVVPLAITVSAPPRSRLAARAGSGDIRVSGTAGWTAVRTGSGEVAVAAVDGEADVTTGSGDIELGPVSGRARVRTGSGAVTVARAGGPTEIKASSGDVTVREVAADLGVRTGSGEVTVADARSGRLDLTTGSGELRIGVHPGVGAELDLSSGSGQARSELEVRSVPPESAPPLQVRGRTGSGDVLVTRAVVPA